MCAASINGSGRKSEITLWDSCPASEPHQAEGVMGWEKGTQSQDKPWCQGEREEGDFSGLVWASQVMKTAGSVVLKRQTQVMESQCGLSMGGPHTSAKETRRKPPEENYSSNVHGKISIV